MRPRFDAYTATVRGVPYGDLAAVAHRVSLPSDRMRHGHGYHGFENKLALRGEDGAEWFGLLWGGDRHRDLVMAECKGERTPEFVAALRETFPNHRCTRTDSASDHDAPGLWDIILPIALRVKRDYKLRGERRGDWDYPEDGRTLYLGAPSSAVRVRIYEKGKEPDYRHLKRPDWVRVECQVRPERDAKDIYARASATDVWGASPFTRELAARILALEVKALPPYAARRLNERDRALAFMCQQYGAHLLSLRDDLGGWKEVGLTLAEMVSEGRKRPS